MDTPLTYEQHVENVMNELLEEWREDESFMEWQLQEFIAYHLELFTPDFVAWLIQHEDTDYQWVGSCVAPFVADETFVPLLMWRWRNTDEALVWEAARWAVAMWDEAALIWADFFDALAAYAEEVLAAQNDFSEFPLFAQKPA